MEFGAWQCRTTENCSTTEPEAKFCSAVTGTAQYDYEFAIIKMAKLLLRVYTLIMLLMKYTVIKKEQNKKANFQSTSHRIEVKSRSCTTQNKTIPLEAKTCQSKNKTVHFNDPK